MNRAGLQRVAVTGLGIVTAIGENLAQFREGLFEEKIEVDELLDDSKVLKIISQMQTSKRAILFHFMKYLQDLGEDIDFEIIKKAIELIKLIKKS